MKNSSQIISILSGIIVGLVLILGGSIIYFKNNAPTKTTEVPVENSIEKSETSKPEEKNNKVESEKKSPSIKSDKPKKKESVVCDYCKETVYNWEDMGDLNFCLGCQAELVNVSSFCSDCGSRIDPYEDSYHDCNPVYENDIDNNNTDNSYNDNNNNNTDNQDNYYGGGESYEEDYYE